MRRPALRAASIAACILMLGGAPCRAAGDAPEEAPRRLRVGWDAGPTYELSQSLGPISRFDPTGLVRDADLRGRIGGSLFLDGGLLHGAASSEEGLHGAVRRARLYTRGVFGSARPTEYKLELAIERERFFLNDFYLRWRFERWIDSIQIGYFDPPVSLEALASSRDRGLMETAPVLSAFAPGFRLGAEVAGSAVEPSLSWALNLSSIGQRPNDAEISSSPLRLTLRGVWRPWIEETCAEPTLLHVGASLRYQIAGGGSVEFRSRAETFLGEALVDTGALHGGFGTLGLELAWRRGPLLVQGEAFGTRVEDDAAGSVALYGTYVQASVAITGEHRPYDAKRGLFDRIEAARPFSVRRGGWGALEATARLGWIDLSDGAVHGGRMLSLHVGPAWTLNRHVRVLAGWVLAHVQDRTGPSVASVLQTRLELWF